MQVVNKSVNPIWNQSFDFVVEDGRHDLLMLELYDHDTFGRVIATLKYRTHLNYRIVVLILYCSNFILS